MSYSSFAPLLKNTLTSDHWSCYFRTACYLIFGSSAIVANAIIIFVINTSRKLRARMVLLTFLAFAELVNGLSFVVAAIGRIELVVTHNYTIPTTSKTCMFTKLWPVALIIAGQLPALMNLMLALESVVAIKCIAMYKSRWNYRHKVALGLFACFACAIGVALAFISAMMSKEVFPDAICSVLKSTGIIYGTVHFLLVSTIYFVSFAIVVAVMVVARQEQITKNELRRQRFLFSVVGFSVLLVAIPHSILLLNEWGIVPASSIIRGVFYSLYCVRSILNLPVYIIFREDFRQQLLLIIHTMVKPMRSSTAPERAFTIRTRAHQNTEYSWH